MPLPVNCPKCGAVLAISETIDTDTGRVRQRSVCCDTKGCDFKKADEDVQSGGETP